MKRSSGDDIIPSRPPKRPSSDFENSSAPATFSQSPSNMGGGWKYPQESATPSKNSSIRNLNYFSTLSESPPMSDDGDVDYTLQSSPPTNTVARDDPATTQIQAAMDHISTGPSPMLERFVEAPPEYEQLDESPPEYKQLNESPTRQRHDSITEHHMKDDGNEVPAAESDSPPNVQDFPSQPVNTRLEAYRQAYEGLTIHLKDFTLPPECTTYPTLAEEALNAYLSHITLIVKIWTNYDSSLKRITLHPSIVSDAGSIALTPNQRARLKLLNDKRQFQFQNIRFDIGTPFRNLYSCFLTATGNDAANLTCQIKAWPDPNGPHVILRTAVRDIFEAVVRKPHWDGTWGLKLTDLEGIAKQFWLKPAMFNQYDNYQSFSTRM